MAKKKGVEQGPSTSTVRDFPRAVYKTSENYAPFELELTQAVGSYEIWRSSIAVVSTPRFYS